MAFLVTFITNILMAIVIIATYFGMLYLILKHYSKSKEVINAEDFELTDKIRINSTGNIVLGLVCIAMVLFIVLSLGYFIYYLAQYYFTIIPSLNP